VIEPRAQVLDAVDAVDPRVARSRSAILRATADLLIEGGSAAVTIEGIAERSKVAKTTIYRHWKTRSQLVFDAFESMLKPIVTEVHDGPISDQLSELLSGLVRGLTDSEWAPAVSGLIEAGDRDPELRELVHDFLVKRFEYGRVALREGIRRGELRADLDLDIAMSTLVGPVFYRRLVSRQPLDGTVVARIVEQFVRGARA